MSDEIEGPGRERWYGSLSWMDSGGCEHVIARPFLDRESAQQALAMAFDVLTELAVILEDPPAPPEQETLRHLWHYRVRWVQADGTSHERMSWEPTGEEAWQGLSDGLEALADIREVLRQVYGPRAPRLIGEEPWDEALARYDAKAEASAGRDAQRLAAMREAANRGAVPWTDDE